MFKNLKTNISRISLDMDVEDVSIPVDEDGDDIGEEQVPTSTKDTMVPWYEEYRSDMQLIEETDPMSITNLQEYSQPHVESAKAMPYCPVFIYKNKEGGLVVTAYITGQIRDVNEYIDLLDILEVMTENDKIYIYIDSPGGYVATGAAIASCIDTCKGKVFCIARGLCASAGSLAWSAGHVCIAGPMANFMYHMSSHMDFGNSEGIRSRAAAQVEYVKKCLLSVAAKKGHITEDELERIAVGRENVFISSQDMNQRLDMGGMLDGIE